MNTNKKALKIDTKNIEITQISLGDHPQFMDHKTVYKIHAPDQGVTAFIGVHSTALGPSLGGIRYKAYKTEDEAITDVLRLSEAMTWKNAAGGLDHGGGKSVIIAKKNTPKPDEQTLEIFAHALNEINKDSAVYFGAEDMNIDENALDFLYERSPWIKGVTSNDPDIVGGTPSPHTAIGVFECLKIAAQYKLDKTDLTGIRVSLQGLGSVGAALAEHLYKAGAILTAADKVDAPFERLKSKGVEITRVELDEIYNIPADIFAPNAIGGTINNETIERLEKAGIKIICGAANNQQQDQARSSQSRLLRDKNILYCPDYMVNAGGVIWVAKVGEDYKTTAEHIRTGVAARFEGILKQHIENPENDMASLAAAYSEKRVRNAEKASQDRHQAV